MVRIKIDLGEKTEDRGTNDCCLYQ